MQSIELPDAALDPYRAGHIVGRKYKLVRRLGDGAAGVVWEAVNTTIDLPVAIKLCRPRPEIVSFKARLRREARLAAMLTHPAVVRVFDYGESFLGDPFIVMEMLDGETLGDLLAREHHLAPASAVMTLLPIASGVHAANLRGIVHRDLKPDNIVITHDDAGRETPKIIDFGIASVRWLDDGRQSEIVGTPEYMPPEQALALDDIDQRADVWAFCALLYEAVSGVTPFGEADYVQALRAIVEESVTPLVELGDLDPALWRIIEKGLSKHREQRWLNMWELGQALAGWLLDQGIEEDTCGASLRAHWLSETRRSSNPILPFPPDDDEPIAIPLVKRVDKKLAS